MGDGEDWGCLSQLGGAYLARCTLVRDHAPLRSARMTNSVFGIFRLGRQVSLLWVIRSGLVGALLSGGMDEAGERVKSKAVGSTTLPGTVPQVHRLLQNLPEKPFLCTSFSLDFTTCH